VLPLYYLLFNALISLPGTSLPNTEYTTSPGTVPVKEAVSVSTRIASGSNAFPYSPCYGVGVAGFAPTRYKVRTVVIDAGHGGKDPGCHGKKHNEKDITLAIALEVGRIIEQFQPEVKVLFTRKKDVFIELNERAAIANRNNADLFISIHCNSGGKAIYGTESYVMGPHTNSGNLDVAKRENSSVLLERDYLEKYDGFNPRSPLAHIFFSNMQSVYVQNSLRFASLAEQQFRGRAGRQSRGVKQAGFLVLWKTAMPSALIETGYLTYPKEEAFLSKETGQVYMASAIYRAFRDYKETLETARPE
jgi:N-acetylmuramoyl-L-alanine amidase